MIGQWETRAGYFGLCDGCGSDLECTATAVRITFFVELVGYCARRYWCALCAIRRAIQMAREEA